MKRSHRLVQLSLAAALLLFASAVAVRHWWGDRLLEEARSEQRRGNIDDAAELYRRASRWGREEAAVMVARIALPRRQWDDLRRYAGKAAAISPLQGYPHLLLGYGREAEVESWGPEEVEYVLDEFRRAVALEPRDGSFWRSYADMALKLYGREVLTWDDPVGEDKYRREVIEAYGRTLAADPRGRRALVAFLVGAVPDASFLMEVTAGSDADLLTELAFQFLKNGRWDRAAEAYWERASGSSSRRSYYLAAAGAYRRMKLHSEAAGVLRAWLQEYPDDADALYLLGGIMKSLGEVEGARRHFERALSLNPGNSTYRKALEAASSPSR